MFIHNRLTQHVSGIIMPIIRRTDCIKPRVVLAWMCWLRFCGVGTRAECTQCAQIVSRLHTTAASTSRLTPHAVLYSRLLMMGIMMPETCWVNLLWINIYTCVICWFFLLLIMTFRKYANTPKIIILHPTNDTQKLKGTVWTERCIMRNLEIYKSNTKL